MNNIITWIGGKACGVLGGLGAEQLFYRACSAANSIYGLGLITGVLLVLAAFAVATLARR
jgi:hypothetical protein